MVKMNRSDQNENGGNSNERENEELSQNGDEEENEEREKGLEELLAVQMVTMESCVNSLELFALKIPSNQKLTTTTQKFRAALDEYNKIEDNCAQVPAPSAVSAISTVSNIRKRREVTLDADQDQDEEEQEKPPKIQQLDAESEEGENSTSEDEMDLDEDSTVLIRQTPEPEPVPVFVDSDFVQIPGNSSYDLDTKSEEEKILILDELKRHFSQFGEISSILISSSLDLQLFTHLQILGENVNRVKIRLATLESGSYASVLHEILWKCPNLTFLDVEQKGEEKKDLDAKALFGLFLMKAVNQFQNERQKENEHREPLDLNLNLTISELRLDFTLYGDSKAFVYKTFAESGVRVKNLALSYALLLKHGPLVVQATTKIFHSSKNVMTQFSYMAYFFADIWNELKIPVMPKLHSLLISAHVDDNNALFGPDFRFSQVPNLETLNLELGGRQFFEELWASPGPDSGPGPAPSVKTLHFSDSGHLYDVEVLLKLFTELDELSFPWRRHGNTSSIWKLCKKLKTLTLFDVKLDSKKSFIRVLAELTGFRTEDVEKLWKRNQNSEEATEIKVDVKNLKQIGPSITALRDLETLTLEPECSSNARRFKSDFLPLFRTLTSEAMPKLGEIFIQN